MRCRARAGGIGWGIGLVAALAFSPAARAQPAPTAGGAAQPAGAPAGGIEDIVVTAQKRSEVLFDVPLTVQAITGQDLERKGIASTADLVREIPSAAVVSSVAPGFDTIEIRGIGSGTTGDGLVGYYLDDTPFGIPNLQLSPPSRLLDLQRVEVTRGPSGTIYGQGSMGGTIKLVTNKPDLENFSGSVATEYSGTEGGGDNHEADIVLNAPIIKDQLGIRISASYEDLGGYARVPEQHLTDANDLSAKNVRALLRWAPTDDVTVDLLYWHIENYEDYNNNLTTPDSPALLRATFTPVLGPTLAGVTASLAYPVQPIGPKTIAGLDGQRDFTEIDADIYSLDANWDTPVGTVTWNSSYIQHKLAFVSSALGFVVDDSAFKTNSFTQEVRIASEPHDTIKYLAGVAFRDATIHSDINEYEDLRVLFEPGVRLPLIDTVGPAETKSYALFGEVSTSLFDDRLEPLVGLRYFNDGRNATGLERPTQTIDSVRASFDSINPRFNLKYNVTDDGNIYFNAAKGFRSGTLQTLAQVREAEAEGIPTSAVIKPDSLWTYEIGSRWRLFDRSVVLEGSLYRTDWKDIQIQFTNAASTISVVNGGDARIQGIDLGAQWRTPLDGLSFSASGTALDTKLTRVSPGLSITALGVRLNGDVPDVAKTTFTVSADYDHEIPSFFGVEFTFDGSYSYRSDLLEPGSGLRSGHIHDLSLRAGLQKGPAKIEVFAQNVLDDDGVASYVNAFAYQIIYPRRVGLRASYSF